MATSTTSKSQRIFIWVIAVIMAVGSVGYYFVIIISSNNQQKQQEEAVAAQQEAQKKAVAEQQSTKLILPGYTADAFDAASVTELKSEDLKVGEGDEVAAGAKVKVNYTGWLPDGTVFDSSNTKGTVTPISLSLDQVIVGWKEGVPGMKVGGVRKLTIPAEKAYGAAGAPPSIPGNTPLAFVIEVVGIDQ